MMFESSMSRSSSAASVADKVASEESDVKDDSVGEASLVTRASAGAPERVGVAPPDWEDTGSDDGS